MDLDRVASRIPDFRTFLTVDEMAASTRELAREYPDLVTVRVVGQSRGGSDIELISIGTDRTDSRDGERHALVVGAPHPNETIGCMTIEFLSRFLCEDDALREELGYTWHFIKAIDPDGVRLNEGWLHGPYTTTHYIRHFFRPANPDQAEFTFPVDIGSLHFDRTMPETAAWMRAIDELRPRFQYSLHNSQLGGAFFLVSDPCPQLYDFFGSLPGRFGLALDPVGEPGLTKSLAPSIFLLHSIRSRIDEVEASGTTDIAELVPAGMGSFEYARDRHGTFTLIAETPYWDSPPVNDQTPSDRSLRDVMAEWATEYKNALAWLRTRMEVVTPHLRISSSRLRAAVEDALRGEQRHGDRLPRGFAGEAGDVPATRAQAFHYLTTYRLFPQRTLTMFVRMLDEERRAGNHAAPIGEVYGEAHERLEAEAARLESVIDYRIIPIRDLVAVQACAGLAAAMAVRDL